MKEGWIEEVEWMSSPVFLALLRSLQSSLSHDHQQIDNRVDHRSAHIAIRYSSCLPFLTNLPRSAVWTQCRKKMEP